MRFGSCSVRLDASANTGTGRKFYSKLCGVAHGETTALGMFLVIGGGSIMVTRTPQLSALPLTTEVVYFPNEVHTSRASRRSRL